MDFDINKMLDDYTNWLRSEITVAEYGEYQELTTPYLDRHNDYLQIYVKPEKNGKLFLTDDGAIINDLMMCGISFRKNSPRKQQLDKIIANYNLELRENCLVTSCVLQNFPQTKHMMLQAMLLIDDMFQLSSEKIKSHFIDDIECYFEQNGIYPVKDVSLLGKSGSVHTYDFVISRSKLKPERFCRGINKLNTSNRNMAIFNWIDTKEKRKDESVLYVILNDENSVKSEDLTALQNYSIEPIMFSERKEKLDLFIA